MARSTRLVILPSVHPDGQTDGQTVQEHIYFMGSETLPIKNIYTLWVGNDFFACYIFSTNLVYPFTLRVTRENAIVEYLDYQILVTQLKGPNGNGDMQAVTRD